MLHRRHPGLFAHQFAFFFRQHPDNREQNLGVDIQNARKLFYKIGELGLLDYA